MKMASVLTEKEGRQADLGNTGRNKNILKLPSHPPKITNDEGLALLTCLFLFLQQMLLILFSTSLSLSLSLS
jgi:hypothetical protein